MKEFWNDRFGKNEFAYGKKPNEFIKKQLPQLEKGKILFPADGEGRNSVYAAELGWEVFAFDYSEKGKEKAESLAKTKNVEINFTVQSFFKEKYGKEEFDVIGLTSVHFEPEIKIEMHKRLDSYLKIGGYIILEAYSKEHRKLNKANPLLGGPPDINMMYSMEEINRDFKNYEIIELDRLIVTLDEGYCHVGESSVIRFLGKKLS